MRYAILLSILVASAVLLSKDQPSASMMEVCDNAIDDDGDGLIDLNDEDCDCVLEKPQSLIPNPSFEEQNCCPAGRSQLNCAGDWIQASQPTTDYLHTCGFMGWENIPTPLPFPDGDGIVGFRDGRNIMGVKEANWKEYAGACLLGPLKKGVEYTFQFYLGFSNYSISPAINLSFFGTPDCDELPFGGNDQFLGCPTNDSASKWSLLKSKNISGSGWVQSTITILPEEDINAIAVGPPCAQTSSSNNLYYFFDNLILAESKFFSNVVEETGNPCMNDYLLSVELDPSATYQWYNDGIAILGETSSAFSPGLENGDYSVMEYIDGDCNLSTVFSYRVPQQVNAVDLRICEDESTVLGNEKLTQSGTYVDTLKTADNCDSIVILDLTVLGDTQDSVKARIFSGDEYEVEDFVFSEAGEYDLRLMSMLGCDSLVHLDLDLYKVYIPNAFSPNEDGVNDVFEIFIEELDLNVASFSIFNRWGNRVFSYDDTNGDGDIFWDGNEGSGVSVGAGLYTYVVEFNIADSENKILAGDVALIK